MGSFGSPYISNMNENKKRVPKVKRDASSDKKKIKKIFTTVGIAFLALALLIGGLGFALDLISDDVETVSYGDHRFYEPDYHKNILEDRLYLSKNRSIKYNRYGNEVVLTENNVLDLPVSAKFFYDYFQNLVNGDHEAHKSFYTESFLSTPDEEKVFPIPDIFTMQGIYDINITLHKGEPDEDNPNEIYEIFEVSYCIFENNGTFRRDILPDETRTLVYELYITNGVAKINAIGYRATA